MQKIDVLIQEADKNLTICNACRYCEGFCPVFPAMERRQHFEAADINYLANLCHNCSECYYACQYAPPHEFGVNIPQSLAKIRKASYQHYAWPGPFARLFNNNGLVASLALGLGASFILLLFLALNGGLGQLFSGHHGGDFYAFFPHNTLVLAFGSVFLFAMLALLMGFLNFWRDSGEKIRDLGHLSAWRQAWSDALSLRHLHGQEDRGCTYPDDNHSHWRRYFHHFTAYGFMLCFAATATGTLFHYVLGWSAPYGFFSLPKLLGTLGGLGLLIGPAGLLYLKRKRDPNTADLEQTGMDIAFIALLWLTAFTGLLLMVLRETGLLGLMLVIHLGFVMSLFLTLPYGKFVHGLYRLGALLKNALEQRREEQGVALVSQPRESGVKFYQSIKDNK
ncbi:TcuB protein [Zobellella denitrificans]|uniref:tricarballylate utilization 4Fe-4S protein TcuB n=1 Tax=Zobellella denitrificans TaxID=347534 RepID=UPI000B8BDA1B|nr:tricarballylate utilization 4Fe-4S protein TcuB [Zobellella denitrificans]OXS15322.1 TcuB protein [Zobellella denitrificans]